MMPSRDTEFGREKFCNVCGDWWPESDEFFYRQPETKNHNLRSPCKACIEDKRRITNAVTPCCVPGCTEPRCHWRLSRCRKHQHELDVKHHQAAKARKAAK